MPLFFILTEKHLTFADVCLLKRNYNDKNYRLTFEKTNPNKFMKHELLETLLRGGITVHGDFFMEIGNVEAGGIGIQIVNGDAHTKPNKPCADVGNLQSIDTPEAQLIWKKAMAAGWVGADRQPTDKLNTKTSRAMFANVMIELLDIPQPSYLPFEALWGENDLGNSFSSGNTYSKNNLLRDEIRRQLR